VKGKEEKGKGTKGPKQTPKHFPELHTLSLHLPGEGQKTDW